MIKKIKTNDQLKEMYVHSESSLAIGLFYDDFDYLENKNVKVHWHDDIEVSMVTSGCLTYDVGGKRFVCSKGDLVFMNTDIPHSLTPLNGCHVTLVSILIQPIFVFDSHETDLYKNCMRPFLHNTNIPCVKLSSEEDWEQLIYRNMEELIRFYEEKPPYYELKLKSLVSESFYQLLTHFYPEKREYISGNEEDLRRLQIILDYLHENYDKPLSLKEVSAKSLLSREACCRLFKRLVGKTITEYLTDYRINKSFRYLSDGSYSMAEIAEACGFSNASRFAKAFRERIGCRPSKYSG